ncbi:uncharacterized protein LOC131879129 isoform X2 [Tigriopus californicus]|uniref:uncharacterized protein LOC131879129 isoform X2 n=1 Tax=Tigriopus californicus TaxID=6832 RepID=UPI0027DA224C|nr:uncharacterized protein LOC131879129 isoform X2 [Tigriopus californicus]
MSYAPIRVTIFYYMYTSTNYSKLELGSFSSMYDLHQITKKSDLEVRKLLLNKRALKSMVEEKQNARILKQHKAMWRRHSLKLRCLEQDLVSFRRTLPILLVNKNDLSADIASELEKYIEAIKFQEIKQEEFIVTFAEKKSLPSETKSFILESLDNLRCSEHFLELSLSKSEQLQHRYQFGANLAEPNDSGYSTCERRESGGERKSLTETSTYNNGEKDYPLTKYRSGTGSKVGSFVVKPELERLLSKSGGSKDFKKLQERYRVYLNHFLKNLDIRRIKCNQWEEFKPSESAIDLYRHFQTMYKNSINFEELANDMFMKVSSKDRFSPVDVKLWLRGMANLKRFENATYEDWSFQTKDIEGKMLALSLRETKDRAVREDFREKRYQQSKICQSLHELLHYAKVKKEEKKAYEKLKLEERENLVRKEAEQKRRREKRRQVDLKKRLRVFKQEQMEIQCQRSFTLKRDLATLEKQRRETALLHYIRVNFRRVVAQKRQAEKEELKKTEASIILAKEARLESLKRKARKHLQLNYALPEVHNFCDVRTKTTTAFRAKVFSSSSAKCEQRNKLNGFHDNTILEDQRVVAESILRENGFLTNNREIVQEVFKRIHAPKNPRPDTFSQISLCDD